MNLIRLFEKQCFPTIISNIIIVIVSALRIITFLVRIMDSVWASVVSWSISMPHLSNIRHTEQISLYRTNLTEKQIVFIHKNMVKILFTWQLLFRKPELYGRYFLNISESVPGWTHNNLRLYLLQVKRSKKQGGEFLVRKTYKLCSNCTIKYRVSMKNS